MRLDQSLERFQEEHPDRTYFDALRNRLPADVTDAKVAEVMVVAKQAGIDNVGQLGPVLTQDNRIWVTGTTPGFRARLDADSLPPPCSRASMNWRVEPRCRSTTRSWSKEQLPRCITDGRCKHPSDRATPQVQTPPADHRRRLRHSLHQACFSSSIHWPMRRSSRSSGRAPPPRVASWRLRGEVRWPCYAFTDCNGFSRDVVMRMLGQAQVSSNCYGPVSPDVASGIGPARWRSTCGGSAGP